MSAPDINEFCFGQTETTPEVALAIWIKTYLTKAQQDELIRMFTEMLADGLRSVDVEGMIAVIETAEFLTE